MGETPPETPDTTDASGAAPEPETPGPVTNEAPAPEPVTPEHVERDCERAPLNRKWLVKLSIIAFFFIGFGAYGLYDAVNAYPARGERFASWAKWQYLDAAQEANREDFGIFLREASVTNPQEAYEYLSEPETRTDMRRSAADQGSANHLRATMRMARLEWLTGLDRIGKLTPEHTTIEDPRAELERLGAKWSSAGSVPKPLKSYDIPSQWGILIVCWFIGGWMILHMVRVGAQRFAWDASSKAITLPGPIEVTPDQLEEVDKRKWDKFIVFLKLKATHPTHGGQEIKVDTYQHAFVEDWILAMEDEAFGPQEHADAAATGQTEHQTSDATPS